MACMVSVIVPVYNSQKYLERCIDSICVQTFKDFELILIDDGSTDTSGAICDNYEKKDSRIRVIHQSNSGAASARNKGIRFAKGEYLMFCDSDDMVSPMWIERLITYSDNQKVLPVGAYCNNERQLGEYKKMAVPDSKVMDSSNYFLFNQVGIAGFLCNALYCREVVIKNNIFIREKHSCGDYNEDLIFSLTYVSKIKKIVYTGYTDYLYDTHENSLSTSYQKYYFEKYQEKYLLWSKFIGAQHKINKNQMRYELASKMLYHFLRALQMEIDNIEFPDILHRYHRFSSIVKSEAFQECVNLADSSSENKRVIEYIQKKKVLQLWLFYLLVKMKGRLLK